MSSKNWKKLLILAVFAGGMTAFFALGGEQWINLDSLKQNRDALLLYTEQHYWGMLVVSLLIYMASTAMSLPIATILSLAVGMLFGRWIGAILIMIAATIGATLAFLGARYLFADAARQRIRGGAAKIIEGFHEHAFNYLVFLRLVPLFPFWLVNLASAFTPVPVRTYVVATAIGILPGCFVFANLGQSLGRIESAGELLSWQTLTAFSLLGVFALLPVVAKKFRARNR